MKQAVIHLTNKQLTNDQAFLLNLKETKLKSKNLNFAPKNKKIPFIDIIVATESTALDLENQNKGNDPNSLRQKVTDILNKI